MTQMYLDTASFDSVRSQAKNPSQPFVYSMGDPTGYGYHAGAHPQFFSNNFHNNIVMDQILFLAGIR